jgi:hypothetical protein
MPKKLESCIFNKWKHFSRHELASDVREKYMFTSNRCTPEIELKEEEVFRQREKAINKQE